MRNFDEGVDKHIENLFYNYYKDEPTGECERCEDPTFDEQDLCDNCKEEMGYRK